MPKAQKDLSEVIQQALDAIDSELEAVRSLPSREWLYNGQKKRIVGSLYMDLRPINLAYVLQIRSKRDFKVKIRVTQLSKTKKGGKPLKF